MRNGATLTPTMRRTDAADRWAEFVRDSADHRFRGVIDDDPDVLVFYAQGRFDGEDKPHVYEVDEATGWLLERGFGRPQFGITADRRTWVVVAPWPADMLGPNLADLFRRQVTTEQAYERWWLGFTTALSHDD